MTHEERPNEKKNGEKDESFYSDVLDALDSALSNEGTSTTSPAVEPTSEITTEETPTFLFPFAPDMNDPNAYPDFQGAKFYVDTRDYERAINTLINILRVQGATTDKNMASELILELAKTVPDQLNQLLPYLILTEGIDDPIIEMNINNSLIYVRDAYNEIITQLKEGVKNFIQTYYSEFNTAYIPFMDILNTIGTSMEVIIKILEIMSKNREITGKLDFTTQVFAYEPPGALYLCPYCGVEIDKNAKFCPHCKEDVFKCAICFRFIKPDELVNCPKCGIPAHEQHFLEWVKKTGSCPVCQNKLYEQEVAHISCVVCGLEIKKEDKNTVKCPYCGVLAHTDHFLDYLKISKACPECKKAIEYKDFKKSLKKKK
ncbi:MAG: zinc-ribbon domain-containing protein [Candidatus Helarchaeota archaeon]